MKDIKMHEIVYILLSLLTFRKIVVRIYKMRVFYSQQDINGGEGA